MSRARFITTIASQGAVDPYAAYTKYYVRKTGNDTTGDGSTGNPWLTVDKAIKTVPIGATNQILVGDGTYNEVSGANNYFLISRKFTALQVIRPESKTYGSVILRGNGDATYNIWINVSNNIRFENFDFTPVSGASRAVLFCRAGGEAISNLQFYGCNIPGLVEINTTSGLSYTGLLIDSCTITQTGAGYSYALQLGPDGVGAYLIDAIVRNCHISGTNHTVLVGGGCNGVTLDNNIIDATGAVYGIVLKECTNITVKNNTVSGGSAVTVYSKAATNCTIIDNNISSALYALFQLGNNSVSGNKSQNITLTNNVMVGSGNSAIFLWTGDTGDAGGCVCDYNTYTPGGSSKFGAVRADANVLTLAELQAAWAGYGDGSNDSHSTVV